MNVAALRLVLVVLLLGASGLDPVGAQESTAEDAARAQIAATLAEQIDAVWVLPPEVAADPVRVTLAVELAPSGLVVANHTHDVSGGSSEAVRAAAVTAALQAVNHFLLIPFQDLPAEHYAIWKSFKMTLDPDWKTAP